MRYFRLIFSMVVMLAVSTLIGCSDEYVGVPPNYLGMKLTPTGYEDHIYTPGQVNILTVSTDGQSNSLVLIQRSGLQIKEQFLGVQASEDKTDHRCLTHDRVPFSLDTRLMLAIPDYETEQGKKDLARLFLLGNPVARKDNVRILVLSAESIYKEQAQLQVRGAIRRICASYPNFEEAFTAFASEETASNFTAKITQAVVQVFKEQEVPIRVVAVQASNMKPDDTVVEAQIALRAAEQRIKAIESVVKYLGNDPTRHMVYKMQVLQEIVAKAGSTGHNTIFLTDMHGITNGLLPLPVGR